MLLRMIEIGEHIDEVVCCDTYKEFPAMYRHIEMVQKVVEDNNIKFTMLRSEQTFDYLMFEHKVNRRNPKYRGNGNLGYGWAGSMSRWCTSKLKTDVFNRYFKKLRNEYNLIRCIGIAADETERMEREHNKNESHRHPLIEWDWSEKDCLDYCYSNGYDWEGLYEIFERVSCWCCPIQPLESLRKLRKNFPELWEELKDMDRRTWQKFRADSSVDELEIRFQLEEEFEKQNKSIRNKEFFNELKKRLNK